MKFFQLAALIAISTVNCQVPKTKPGVTKVPPYEFIRDIDNACPKDCEPNPVKRNSLF